ncbi:hypothetical protein [Streptomyces chartreusis]
MSTTQPVSAADGRPYANPLKSFKGADPWLQYHDGNSASSCQTAD